MLTRIKVKRYLGEDIDTEAQKWGVDPKGYFWIESKLEDGSVELRIIPLVKITDINIVIPKELAVEGNSEGENT